jgi:hypothetical protein
VNTNFVPKTVSRQSDDLSFACMVMEVKHAPQILDSIFCIFQLQLIAFNHFCQENNLDKPTIVGDRPLHGNVERSRDDTVSHTLGRSCCWSLPLTSGGSCSSAVVFRAWRAINPKLASKGAAQLQG